MAHFLVAEAVTNYAAVAAGASLIVDLWGAGPGNTPLTVVVANPGVATIAEVPVSTRPDTRRFQVTGRRPGTTRMQARVGAGGAIWAETRLVVGGGATRLLYYHGTSLERARQLMTDTIGVFGGLMTADEWEQYTDFGKGFYVHKEENKHLAFAWAKEKFSPWGVVEFCLLATEYDTIREHALYFRDKRARPGNAPILLPPAVPERTTMRVVARSITSLPYAHFGTFPRVTTLPQLVRGASWLEFVEYNRHIDRSDRIIIQRPNDHDWTGAYSVMIGPLWVPRDSGYDRPRDPFPDHIHQVNWGQAGLNLLNSEDAKQRRFLYTAENEALFRPAQQAAAR